MVSSFLTSSAYGHGLGGETHPPITLEGRDVTLSINISPSTYDVSDLERYITITLNESKSQSMVEHVTFALELTKDGNQIFRRYFHDDLGNLVIKVIEDNSDNIQIKGDKSHGIEAWMRTTTERVTMTGNIFNSGGLYEYKIEIVTVDSDFNFLDRRYELVGAISLAENNLFEVTDSEQKTHQLNLISYFDKIENFEFSSNKVSFSMPFDWDQDLEQLSVVHEEIRIPQGFSDFLHTKYQVMINDIQLKDKLITIDDYSSEGRTVHIVINKENLKQIREDAKQKSDSKMYFEIGASKNNTLPLEAVTPDLRYRVYLTWDPEIIKANEDVTFFLKTEELFTNKTNMNIEYELELSHEGNQIYKEHVSGFVNTETSDEFQFKFSPENTGTVKLNMYDIEGNFLSNVNFLIVVKPSDKEQFPIKLDSISKSNPNEGKYAVDLTWFPNTLELGESEFVMTFYEKDSKIPVKNATYDFVLIKEGTEIYRQSGIAKSGGTFENFVFVEGETGDVTLRIDKIADTDEYVEIPIKVAPEFPIGIMIFFAMMIIPTILFSKTKFFNNHP